MLYVFGFEQIGVVVGDLYFVDPDPDKGQEGAERGVRLEVRMLDREPLKGSIYSATPINIAQPIWRADLLESIDGPIGTFDRTHHHPAFTGWEPGGRRFVPDLSADPLGFVARRLADLRLLLTEAKLPAKEVEDLVEVDGEALRAAVPEVMDAVRRLLTGIAAGELAVAPPNSPVTTEEEPDVYILARSGWL